MFSEIIDTLKDDLANLDILDKIESEEDRMMVVDWVNNVCAHVNIAKDLTMNVVIEGNDRYILCMFKDADGYTCKGGLKVEKSIDKTLNKLLEFIENGLNAIGILNKRMEEVKAANGILIDLKYKWGTGNTEKIAYWNYDTMYIKLGKRSVERIIELTKEDNIHRLETVLENTSWSDSIPDLIAGFDEHSVNNLIGANLASDNAVDNLTENMLTFDDMKVILSNNKITKGLQRFTSVHTISELGIFIAIVLWNIDYEEKTVQAEILGEKVIDLENNRFVSDHSLYSRLEKKILSDVSKVEKCLQVA